MKRLISGVIIFSFIFLQTALSNSDNSIDVEVFLKTSKDSWRCAKDSVNQFPNFKQYDWLSIEEIYIKNEGNTSTPHSRLNFYINQNNAKEDQKFFLNLPPIEPSKQYNVKLNCDNNKYVDEKGKDLLAAEHLNGIQLVETGRWVIKYEVKPHNELLQSPEVRRFRVNGQRIDNEGNINFNVETPLVLETFSQSKVALIIAWVGLVVGLIDIVTNFIVNRSNIKQQKRLYEEERTAKYNDEDLIQVDLLRGISLQIEELERSIKGHRDEIGKDNVPTYSLPQLDYTFYTTHLKGFIQKGATKDLKRSLRKCGNKIENVNRLIFLAQLAFVLSKESKFKRLITELKEDNFKYYRDLEEDKISKLKGELKKWINNS